MPPTKNIQLNACLPAASRQYFSQFGNFLALLGRVSAGNGMFDAMADMILEDCFFDAAQGGANRRNLRNNVNAISLVFDHARDATDLTLDLVEALEAEF